MKLSDLVKSRRLAMGFSARQLARKVGVSHSYISQIENGTIRRPSPSVLKRIVQVLKNCDLRELLVASGYEVGSESPMEKVGADSQGQSPEKDLDIRELRKKTLENLLSLAEKVAKSTELLEIVKADPSEFLSIPLFTTIPASFGQPDSPTVHSYDECEVLRIHESKLNYDPACFALRVKGDSMVDAGILNDDIVVVSPNTPYQSGDICVVRINGDEHSIKRLIISGNFIILQPANSNYEPIVVDTSKESDLFIYGKVIYVERTLL